MKRIHQAISIMFISALLFQTGCGVGYDRMIFYTKTNVGIDMDTQPPTVQLSIGRTEGVFQPTYEGGGTLPVFASFKFQDQGFLSPQIGTAFSTGDAAQIMTTLYGHTDKIIQDSGFGGWELDLEVRDELMGILNGKLKLKNKPTFPDFVEEHVSTEVRPVIFGTDTSLGIKIGWSGLTAQLPDTFRFGFTRKELAWSPIFVVEDTSVAKGKIGRYVVGTPSLLATLDTGLAAQSMEDSDFKYMQYFATGSAANALAMRKSVRNVMLRQFDEVESAELFFATGPLRDRIQDWMLADVANQQALQDWLAGEEIDLLAPMWVRARRTSKSELEQAIIDLSIPESP